MVGGFELRRAEAAGAFPALKLAGLKFLLGVGVTGAPRGILLPIPSSSSTDTMVQQAKFWKKGEGGDPR